ncbi:MAG: beta-ketoacyl-ACP synthase II [Rubrobacteraceae bacterium]
MTEGLPGETSNGKGRALVTGTGAVTPIGTGTENFWDAALHGKSGIDEITLFDPSPFPSHIAGECTDFDPTDFMSKKEARRMDRYAQFGIAAGIQAAESAGIVDTIRERPERVAIVIGSGIGGLSTWEREYKVLNERGPNRVSPFLITMMVPNMAAGQLAIMLGATGPTQVPVLACATGGEAIAEGLELIRRGDADVAIAGSAEAPITPLSMAGFCAIRAISTRNEEPHRASRPFDSGRDGFAMSEGAGAVVLESVEHAESRGAEPIAAVAGYGRSTDAYHVTAPDEQGRGVERAMRLALADSGLSAEDIGHVNAHATSTPTGDGPETKAISRVMPQAAVSATKSMTGHSFGAVGATEGIMCALAIKHKVLPPTINLEELAEDCEELDYVGDEPREVPNLNAAISNSMGFGGHNIVVSFTGVE